MSIFVCVYVCILTLSMMMFSIIYQCVEWITLPICGCVLLRAFISFKIIKQSER